MKRLNVTVTVSMVGDSSILVPDELNLDEAIEYAKNHLHAISLPENLEYIESSDIIDEDNCDFDDSSFPKLAIFDTHGADSVLNKYSGFIVSATPIPPSSYDFDDVGQMYHCSIEKDYPLDASFDAFEDELRFLS